MRASRPLALILTCAAALAACGGDDGLSAEDYRAQANAACDRYEQDIKAIEEPKNLDEVAPYAEQASARLDELMDEFETLDPPSDLSGRHDELVRLGRQSVDELSKLEEIGDADQQEQLQGVLATASELDTQSDQLARDMGLDSCVDQN